MGQTGRKNKRDGRLGTKLGTLFYLGHNCFFFSVHVLLAVGESNATVSWKALLSIAIE